jgi:DDE superfamily endonuclease
VDKRLCRPAVWWTDAYAGRRTPCNVPAALTWQSQPPLAAARLQTSAQEALLPCKYVVADGLSGHSPAFLDAVDKCIGVTAFVAMPAETRGGLQAPRTTAKT